jgi:DNA-binding transcriptional MerR regulator
MPDTTLEPTPPTFTISELAAEFRVTTRTLRFYEAEGMLTPNRVGTTRVYAPRDRTRLRLILRGKRIGLPLAEIREIVDMYEGPRGEAGQLAHLVRRIEERTDELVERRAEIERILTDLDEVATNARARLAEIDDG